MRLKQLLLGSAGAIALAGSSSGAAQAADVTGLVTSMVSYLASCADGDGIQFTSACLTFNGQLDFYFGDGTSVTYGDDPTLNVLTSEAMTLTSKPDFGFDVTWTSAGGKNVSISWDVIKDGSLITPQDPGLTIENPGAWKFFIEREHVALTYYFNAWSIKTDLDNIAGGSPDLTVTLSGDVGDVGVDLEVASDALTDPLFDGRVQLSFGDWDITLRAFTRDWTPFLPGVDVAVGGSVGPADLDLFFGWRDEGGGAHSFAVAAQAAATFGMTTATAGVMHGQGAQGGDWDDSRTYSSNFTDDYGVFPYVMTAGQTFWAFWGGASMEWNDSHTTGLTVFFSESTHIVDSENLRLALTHTWTPHDGDITITGKAWLDNDFGGAAVGWGHGFSIALNVPLFP